MVDAGDRLNKELLKEKKKKFIEFVYRTVADLGYESPKIRFWKDTCPSDSGNELAHIHLDRSPSVICISLRRLKQMTMEQIEETATHEVAHIGNPEHDSILYFTIDAVRLKNWRPPSGVQEIDGNAEVYPISDSSYKPKEKECNYHLCNKRKNLQPCSLCKEVFCSEHLEPKAPAMFSSEQHTTDDRIKDYEYHKDGGHPCLKYYDDYDYSTGKKIEEIYKKIDKKHEREQAKERVREQAKEQEEFEKRMQEYSNNFNEKAKKKNIPKYWIEKAPERPPENTKEEKRLKETRTKMKQQIEKEKYSKLCFWNKIKKCLNYFKSKAKPL